MKLTVTRERWTLTLTKEQALTLLYCHQLPTLGLTFEDDTEIHESRWTMHHQLVITDKGGHYWATTYERGLTENQDITPFEDDGDEIEFTPVEKVPVITYEYRDIKPEGGIREPAGDRPDSPAPGEARLPGPGGPLVTPDANADYAGV